MLTCNLIPVCCACVYNYKASLKNCNDCFQIPLTERPGRAILLMKQVKIVGQDYITQESILTGSSVMMRPEFAKKNKTNCE